MLKVESLNWGHREDVWDPIMERYESKFISHTPNSAGGVEVEYTLSNYGNKAVRKYSVVFTPYNGADEKHIDEHGNCDITINGYDRIKANDKLELKSAKPIWYSFAIRDVKISSIEVVYEDGTTKKCEGNYTPTLTEVQLKYPTPTTKDTVTAIIYLVFFVAVFIIAPPIILGMIAGVPGIIFGVFVGLFVGLNMFTR